VCFIKNQITESVKVIQDIEHLEIDIKNVSKQIVNCIKNGKKIIIFGNGGSAADAQHIAAEFIGRFKEERSSFPAISLTTDTSVLTSLSNDYSNDIIFSRQCEGLVNLDDVVLGISTSGNSINVKKALAVSKSRGAITIGLLGNNGGAIKEITDFSLIVNSSITSKIQEAHRVIYHIICEIVENELIGFDKK
jgi:D-sedoheptulose 7-phosphate isomerase